MDGVTDWTHDPDNCAFQTGPKSTVVLREDFESEASGRLMNFRLKQPTWRPLCCLDSPRKGPCYETSMHYTTMQIPRYHSSAQTTWVFLTCSGSPDTFHVSTRTHLCATLSLSHGHSYGPRCAVGAHPFPASNLCWREHPRLEAPPTSQQGSQQGCSSGPEVLQSDHQGPGGGSKRQQSTISELNKSATPGCVFRCRYMWWEVEQCMIFLAWFTAVSEKL